MTTHISVDVEADGPIPGLYSMVCFGAVVIDRKLDRTFYGETKPTSDLYIPDALAVSGFSRQEHEKFADPLETMWKFDEWLASLPAGNKIFWADNPAFDWQWINYYFHKYVGKNPFGFSARRIGDVFCGMHKDPYHKWKHHRITKHTHNPVDDAKGNAEAILYLVDQGFKLKV